MAANLPAPVTGRPSAYDPELAGRVLEFMLDGKSLTRACRVVGVPLSTMRGWIDADRDGLSARYAHARDVLLERLADEILDIADDASGDFVTGEGGEVAFDHEHAMRTRTRIDSRKWLLSKLRPERYGDNQKLKVDGQVTFTELVTRAAELRRKRLEAQAGEAGQEAPEEPRPGDDPDDGLARRVAEAARLRRQG